MIHSSRGRNDFSSIEAPYQYGPSAVSLYYLRIHHDDAPIRPKLENPGRYVGNFFARALTFDCIEFDSYCASMFHSKRWR